MISLLNQAKKYLSKNKADPQKDQFFLVNYSVIEKLIKAAEIRQNDLVLEIGPGLGFITRALAKIAKRVIAIEIDEKFRPYLERLPTNVKIIYGDAYKLLNDRHFTGQLEPPTKVVANIPYSQAQNMLHNYTESHWYQGDLFWVCPASLINKVNQEHVLSAYFEAKLIARISKNAFYPQPKTSSAIVHFGRIVDPKTTGDFDVYFRRWLYCHQGWKLKNALREGIINFAQELKGKFISKNQAREVIEHLKLSKEELEKQVGNLKPDDYFQITARLKG